MELPDELVSLIMVKDDRGWQRFLCRRLSLADARRRAVRIASLRHKYNANRCAFLLQALYRADLDALEQWWPKDVLQDSALMQYSDCIGTTIFGDLRSLACLRLLASRGLQIVTLLARAIDVNQRKLLLGSDFAFEFIFGSNDLNYFILRSCLQYLLFEYVPADVETVLRIIDGYTPHAVTETITEALWLLEPEEVLPLFKATRPTQQYALPICALSLRYNPAPPVLTEMREIMQTSKRPRLWLDTDEDRSRVEFWTRKRSDCKQISLFPPHVSNTLCKQWYTRWGTVDLEIVRKKVNEHPSGDLTMSIIEFGYQPYYAAVSPTCALREEIMWMNKDYAAFWQYRLSADEIQTARRQILARKDILPMSCKEIRSWLTCLNISVEDFVNSYQKFRFQDFSEREQCLLAQLLPDSWVTTAIESEKQRQLQLGNSNAKVWCDFYSIADL